MTLIEWAIARARGIRKAYMKQAWLCAYLHQWGLNGYWWHVEASAALAFAYGEYTSVLEAQAEALGRC